MTFTTLSPTTTNSTWSNFKWYEKLGIIIFSPIWFPLFVFMFIIIGILASCVKGFELMMDLVGYDR